MVGGYIVLKSDFIEKMNSGEDFEYVGAYSYLNEILSTGKPVFSEAFEAGSQKTSPTTAIVFSATEESVSIIMGSFTASVQKDRPNTVVI